MSIKLKRVHFSIIIVALAMGCTSASKAPNILVDEYVKAEIDSVELSVAKIFVNVSKRDAPEIHRSFEQARHHYKKVEWFIEYAFGEVNVSLNGPAIDKSEEYDDRILEATGFQVVEELIYPSVDLESLDELKKELEILQSILGRVKFLLQDNLLADTDIFYALKLQVFRIESLGISGFDSPIALNSLNEAVSSLLGIREIISIYSSHDPTLGTKLDRSVLRAIDYLQQNPEFDSFDRAEFIVSYLNPLSSYLVEYQENMRVPFKQGILPVSAQAANFFEIDALRKDYFPARRKISKPKAIELGRLLFFDPILSGNQNRSCASCHKPQKAFTDGLRKSQAFGSNGSINRNAPTLINATYQLSQFWDLRVSSLEDQVADVVSNPDEMHGQIAKAAELVNTSDEYRTIFSEVFDDSGPVTDQMLLSALVSYIRSITSLNSPFDQYMRGDKSKLSDDQVKGFNLFMGKAKCGTCHFLPLFNGAVPPRYLESESEVLGVPMNSDTINAVIDPDLGKFKTYPRDLNKYAFKTPTVRNSALTAPYMHNGVYETMDEVIDFYNRGGGAGIGIDLPNQTLPTDRLLLTADEQSQLIEFIDALTDTVGLTQIPNRLPKFGDDKLNKRKVGGVY